jgi:uncharacterized HAD superfamily protein
VKIGIDMDGVLCDYVKGYNALAKAEFNVDLPYPATTWDHGPNNGITKEQDNFLWAIMKDTPFYGSMIPLQGAVEAVERLNELSRMGHDIYFITSRPGKLAKFWSELWLKWHGMALPTVLIAKEKGYVALGLRLDVFVDDKPENNYDVMMTAKDVRVYLVRHTYNKWAQDQPHKYGIGVSGLLEVLDSVVPRTERKAA